MLLLTAKSLAIFFGLATTAFCVATIVLAVQKSNLEDELQDAIEKLDKISTLVTPSRPTSPTTPLTPTVSTPSIPTGSTESKPTTQFPWPTITVPNEPSFPTLPPGLPDPEEIIYRLPNDIRPIKYKLYIHPELKAKTCEGTVSIQIEIEKETNLIVLHAKNLDIDSISILNMMARMRIRVNKSYVDESREMLFIELEEILYTSTPYTVSISYRCKLEGLVGIYASSYLGADNEDRRRK